MKTSIHRQAVDLILASMSSKPGSGLRSSFMFGKPQAPYWDRRIGVELYYERTELVLAALFLREKGPSYYKYLPVDDLIHIIRDFVKENYYYIADETLFRRFDGNYAQQISENAKETLAAILAKSNVFHPGLEVTLFPLVPIQVLEDFYAESFFVTSSSSLDQSQLGQGFDSRRFLTDNFPPHVDWDGRTEKPNGWIGVRSPIIQVASKMRSAILGAIALTLDSYSRHVFSGRHTFGGRCTIGRYITVSFSEPHMPPLMDDIVLSSEDHDWLSILNAKLLVREREVRRELKALEYYFRGWELGPSERFPVLCMALDAVFGDANHATQAVIDAVRGALGSHIQEPRLRLLMELRASVIHGGAPDVYDSSKYARYYREYHADPIHDLELIVASCLRVKIFGGKMKEHLSSNYEKIETAVKIGAAPRRWQPPTILDGG